MAALTEQIRYSFPFTNLRISQGSQPKTEHQCRLSPVSPREWAFGFVVPDHHTWGLQHPLAGRICPLPVNPGPTAQYPDNATQYQIQAANKAYEMATKIFNQYDACDHALKQLLIGAVDDIFINTLCDRHVGYANVSTRDLLTHLYNTYGKITEVDLNKNQEVMGEAFGPNLPIESFF